MAPIRILAALVALGTMAQGACAHGSSPVPIAVIDTGVAQVGTLRGMTERTIDADTSGRSVLSSGHGTMVASVIARYARRPIRIMPYRVDSGCSIDACDMPVSRLAWAVRDATRRGAAVIQISSYGRLTAEAVHSILDAARSGIDVVLCAGNDGRASVYSGLLETDPRIHVVGALGQDGRPTSFSSTGGRGMVWRRGTGLMAQDERGRDRLVDGTSFAASLYTAELIGVEDAEVARRPMPGDGDRTPTPMPDLRRGDGQSRAVPPAAQDAVVILKSSGAH